MANDLPNASRSGYIPTLDGWRAIAVLGVVAFHAPLLRIGIFSDAWLHDYGFLGVDLFFAISGLLICSRLLDEENIHQNISLKAFYIRRFCRILPPAFLYLAALGILGLAHIVRVDLASWLCSILFVNNYRFAHLHTIYYFGHLQDPELGLYTNHFWSLAVEEHFYLLLPGILYFFPKRRVRILSILILFFLALSIVVRAHPSWMIALGGNAAYARTELRINALLFPALLAILLRREPVRAFCTKWATPLFILLVFGFALIAALRLGIVPADWLVLPFALPFLVAGTALRPASHVSRLLELAPLRWMGRISYSVYLWQQLFFIGSNVPYRAARPLGFLQVAPWNLLALVLVASASYFLIEKPFIRLGHRLAPPATPGHRDLDAGKRPNMVADQV
ncbi:MAG TPA: acyltransferase [Terracidiphilus sp.]|nr:acyltransferase [Terracidiphilus sp.]